MCLWLRSSQSDSVLTLLTWYNARHVYGIDRLILPLILVCVPLQPLFLTMVLPFVDVKYMNEYFPLAIETARQFLSNPDDVKAGLTYTWMGFSFLFDIYLNCKDSVVNIKPGAPSNLICPSAENISQFEAAISLGPAGGITWQAFPHNAEPELLVKSQR